MKVLHPFLRISFFIAAIALFAAPAVSQEVVYVRFEEGAPYILVEALKAAGMSADAVPADHVFEKPGGINADLRMSTVLEGGHWGMEVTAVGEGGWYFEAGQMLVFVPLPAKGSKEYASFQPVPGAVFLAPQKQKIDIRYEGKQEGDKYVVTLLANHGLKNFPDAGEVLLSDNGGLILDGTRSFDKEHPIAKVRGLDMWVVVGYMVLMLLIGFLVAGKNKGGSDFFKGGSHMPWWLAGVSLFMSCFSTYTFVGGAGAAYDKIVLALILYFCNIGGFLFGYIILAARWRRTRALTTMQYLEERYDNATHQLFSWSDVVIGFFYAATQLLSLVVVVAAALDLSAHQMIPAIIVIGGVILIYTVVGGFWAVCLTDMLQFIVLLPIVLVLAWVSLSAIGGFSAIVDQLPARFFAPTELPSEGYRDVWFIIANLAMMIFAFSSGGAAQRYFAVRNESGAKKVALLTAVLFLFGPIIWFVPPMVASWLTKTGQMTMVELMPGKPLAECSYILMCRRLLPPGLVGLVLSAMFAATMSSIDTNFNWRGAIVTRDIIQKYFMPNSSDRMLLFVGRIVTFLMGSGVIGLCIYIYFKGSSLFRVMFDLGAFILIPAGVPIVFGLLTKTTRKWSAFWSLTVGLSLGLLKWVFSWAWVQKAVNDAVAALSEGGSADQGLAWLVRAVAAFFGMSTGIHVSDGINIIVIGAIVMLIYFAPSLFSRERNKEYLDRVAAFWKKMHTPIDEATEVGPVTAGVSSFALTGILTIVIGVGVLIMYPFSPDVLVLWTAGITILIGVLIWAAGQFAKEKE